MIVTLQKGPKKRRYREKRIKQGKIYAVSVVKKVIIDEIVEIEKYSNMEAVSRSAYSYMQLTCLVLTGIPYLI